MPPSTHFHIFLWSLLPFARLCSSCEETGCYSKLLLDTLSQLFSEDEFNNNVWNQAVTCIQNTGDGSIDALLAQDNLWRGFVDHGLSDGPDDGSDMWGDNEKFAEFNPTALSDRNSTVDRAQEIIIREPCNTISNLAFFRTLNELCRSRDRFTFSSVSVDSLIYNLWILPFGSAFYHASGTRLGKLLDGTPIRLALWTALQASLEDLPYSPVLSDLQETPIPIDAVEATSEILRIPLDINNVQERWIPAIARIRRLDPEQGLIVGTIISNIVDLVAGDNTTNFIVETLGGLLLNSREVEFLKETYLPAFRAEQARLQINPSVADRGKLLVRATGFGLKLVYALLFQETELPGPQLIYNNPLVNFVARFSMPGLNLLANLLTGYTRTDSNLQLTFNVYPGDGTCRFQQPHSRWHEESANYLIDLFFICDDIKRVLNGGEIRAFNNDLSLCFLENECVSEDDVDALEPFLDLVTQSCFLSSIGETGFSMGNYGRCMFVSLVSETGDAEGLPDALDTCLVENDCIGFSEDGSFDMRRLQSCFSFLGDRPCRQYLDNPFWPYICMLTCVSNDPLCAAACLEGSAAISPVTERALACYHLMWGWPGDGKRQLLLREQCGAALPRGTEAAMSALNVFSKVALCSSGVCQVAFRVITSLLGSVL